MSVNVRTLRERVVRPALAALGLESESAIRLVLGTGAVESGFTELEQMGGGPALGFWQMEPATHHDLWVNYLNYRPELANRARSLAVTRGAGGMPEATEMAWNHRYAAAMCRVHYLRDPNPLPSPFDVVGLATTWKEHYNTRAGRGTVNKFLEAYRRLVAPVLS